MTSFLHLVHKQSIGLIDLNQTPVNFYFQNRSGKSEPSPLCSKHDEELYSLILILLFFPAVCPCGSFFTYYEEVSECFKPFQLKRMKHYFRLKL